MRLSICHLYRQVSALLILAASLAVSCVTAFAGEVGLAWDAKTEPEIVGYKIYYQVASKSDVRSIDVGNVTTYRVPGLDPDTYYFCVSAYDNLRNETACSNGVSIIVWPPMYVFRNESIAAVRGCFSRRTVFRKSQLEPPLHRSAQKDLFKPLNVCLVDKAGSTIRESALWKKNIGTTSDGIAASDT